MTRPKKIIRRMVNSVLQGALDRYPVENIISLDNYIRIAYRLILHRAPDSAGFQHYKSHIENQHLPASFVFEALASSPEHKKALNPLSYVRTRLVELLPPARIIVDFGGSTKHMQEGALYAMGYRQKWQKLIVVDLPSEERDIQWQSYNEEQEIVSTPNGPVEHIRGSMADRSVFTETGFADMAWSGNSIEHISESEADDFLKSVYDILKPDGIFCLDTPNRSVTKLQCPDQYTNPDHKIEYTHDMLSRKLEQHGFRIEEQLGVLDCSRFIDSERFTSSQLQECPDFTDDIEKGYFLYYRCSKI